MNTKLRYSPEELSWLKTNYELLGSHACAVQLQRSINSVRRSANAMGCYISQQRKNELHSQALIQSFTPCILPETFIEVKLKEAAYVLGLLWADGWVQHKTDYSINIKLVEEDFTEILPVFYTLGNWKKYRCAPLNRKPTIQLRASGKQLVDFFLSVDYLSKSTAPATKILSQIPDELKRYWWRGYFDGDGHIHSTHPYRLEFSSTWDQDWSFLPAEYPFQRSIIRGKHSYSKMRLVSKKEIIKFGKMLWDNWDGIGFTRKHTEFTKFL